MKDQQTGTLIPKSSKINCNLPSYCRSCRSGTPDSKCSASELTNGKLSGHETAHHLGPPALAFGSHLWFAGISPGRACPCHIPWSHSGPRTPVESRRSRCRWGRPRDPLGMCSSVCFASSRSPDGPSRADPTIPALWQPASCAHSNEGVASLARPQPRSRQVHLSHRGAWRTLAACQRGMLHQLRRSWWPATGPGSRAGNDRCVLSSSCSNLWRLRAVFPPSLGHWFRHSHSGLPSEQPRGLHVPRQLQWHLWGQGLWPQQSRSADTPFIIGMGPWAIYGHILLKLPRVHTSTWPSQHIQGYEHMHYANSWNIKTTKGKHIRFHPINQFLVSSMHIASVETCFNPWQCLSQIRTLGTFHGTRLSRITHHMVRWKNAGKGFFVQAGVFATAWRRHDEKWWVDAMDREVMNQLFSAKRQCK